VFVPAGVSGRKRPIVSGGLMTARAGPGRARQIARASAQARAPTHAVFEINVRFERLGRKAINGAAPA